MSRIHALLGLLIASTLLLLPLAAADPVAVSTDGDAHGDLAAVSVFGDASCGPGVPILTFLSLCLAASGTGDAGASNCEGLCGVAVSGTGDIDSWGGASGTGNATGNYVFSGANHCRFPNEPAFMDCVAVSPDGSATSHWLAISILGDANSTVALSATGNASGGVAFTPTGTADRGAAFSLTGASDGYELGGFSGTGPASGNLWAISLTGPATGHSFAISVAGDARSDGCAVSVLGTAEGDCVAWARTGLCNDDNVCLP